MRKKIIMCILYLTLIGSLIPLILFTLKYLERNGIDDKVEKTVETIEVDDRSSIQKAFEEIWAINKDVVAFLYFPNTDTSFSVLLKFTRFLCVLKRIMYKKNKRNTLYSL